MTDKVPIRAVFDGTTATGLAEFQSGDTIGLSTGGTGASLSLGSAGQTLLVNSGGTAVEFGSPTVLGNTLTFGAGTSGTDITITFDGETNDGVLKWMEDEDYFEFSDDILIASTEKIQFRDTGIFINSSTDGQLDIDADTELEITAPTVDINASTAVTVSNDLKLDSDAAVLGFGADNDVTLTHVADTGLLLNSTMAIQFNDASQFINAPSATVLDINATDEIELNATLIDINGNVDISGTLTVGGALDFGDLDISNVGSIALDTITNDGTDITLDSSGDIILDADGGDVFVKDAGTTYGSLTNSSGNLVIKSGSTTAMTFSGANVTFAGTVTIGSAGISEAELEILDGATVTTTELNILDGDTSATSTTVADADRVVLNDNGTMVQVAVTDLAAYFDDEITAMPNLVTTAATTVGALNSGSITSGFGSIDNGSSTITTTGLISGGSLDIDDVLINGSTIGHTDDTDLITVASGLVTVAGEVSLTTLDIGGTNVTSTAAELNILDGVTSTATELNIMDGDTSASSTTVADADRVVFNDAGTMKQVAVTDLAAYFDDEITAMPNLVTTAATTVGALNSGSITSGFGTIDTGSSTITTTGLISGGSLDIDNVLINGTTIGHTDDTDLITVADGLVTVAGEISVTTLDIGGTNVTSTAAELNIIDGGTSATSTTVVDADRVVMNDNGTMVQVAVTDLAAYFDDEITAMPNLITTAATTVGALDSGSITSGFGTIDTGSSTITTTGAITGGSLVADNITIDGTEIDLSSGDLTIDVAGSIILDADNDAVVQFKDGGTTIGQIFSSSQDLGITASVQDKDIKFFGNDGGSSVTALTLDMSDAGKATFNGQIVSNAGSIILDNSSNIPNLNFFESGAQKYAIGESANIGGGGAGFYDHYAVSGKGLRFFTGAAHRLTIDSSGSIIPITAGTSNVKLGLNAGDSIASGGNYNTVIGEEAGTAINTGDSNTLVGYASGDAITIGTNNVAVGSNSLGAEVAGQFSVAIGANALAAQTSSTSTDVHNVAVGLNSGISVTSGINNVFMGSFSGDAVTDADFNVAIGTYALSSNVLGSQSTALGHAALFSQNPTTATNMFNTAIGNEAGNDVTTGIQNTFVGALAGDAVTAANQNVAMGYSALTSDTLGSKSTAVGYAALNNQNLTTATDAFNTAVGSSAGVSMTTGILNVFVGANAGDAMTDADGNTAVGANSLTTDTMGLNSTAVGVTALHNQNFTTATQASNTAVGSAAGYSITTGTKNVIMGHLAGDNMTTGSNNVVLGYNSGLSATDTAQVIVLGSGVTSQPANNFTFGFGATDSNIAFGATSITAPSDVRLKEDIQDEKIGLDFIKDLRPVTFRWKKAKDIDPDMRTHDPDSDERVMNGKYNHGFIAQEVKEVIDSYSDIKDGFDMWSADPTDGRQRIGEASLMPIMVKALQELSAKNDALEARIATLEG